MGVVLLAVIVLAVTPLGPAVLRILGAVLDEFSPPEDKVLSILAWTGIVLLIKRCVPRRPPESQKPPY
jgi:hypothetical protein